MAVSHLFIYCLLLFLVSYCCCFLLFQFLIVSKFLSFLLFLVFSFSVSCCFLLFFVVLRSFLGHSAKEKLPREISLAELMSLGPGFFVMCHELLPNITDPC